MLECMLFFAAVGFLVGDMSGAAVGVIVGGVAVLLARWAWSERQEYLATRYVRPCKWHERGHWAVGNDTADASCLWLSMWTVGGVIFGSLLMAQWFLAVTDGSLAMLVGLVVGGLLGGLLPHVFYRLRRRTQGDRQTAKGDRHILPITLYCLLALASSASAGPRCEPPCMWELWRTYEDRWIWVSTFETAESCEHLAKRREALAQKQNTPTRYRCHPSTETPKVAPL